jgi:hypothetical protein
MPLVKYFSLVGTALLLLLFGLNWLVPQPADGPVRSGVDKTVIRISSVERLPERVVIDTSLPTIVPPHNVVEFSGQATQSTLFETDPGPRQTIRNNGSKTQRLVKHEPVKKPAAHRGPPPSQSEPAPLRSVEAAAPITRLSLLDWLKERLEQSFSR